MEFLDVVNERDEVLTSVSRDGAHLKHLLHRSVHVMISNKAGEVLLQLRSAKKEQYPGYWTGSVSGHVSSGENPAIAVLREMKEEIGIHIPLRFLGSKVLDDVEDRRIIFVFQGTSEGPFILDKTEMERAEFFPLAEVKRLKLTPGATYALSLLESDLSK